MRRTPRFARGLLAVSGGLLLLLSMPEVAGMLTRTLGAFEPYHYAVGSPAQAIVILSAEQSDASEYGGVTVGPMTLARVRYGVRLAEVSGLPILVTGGPSPVNKSSPSIAEMMQGVLRDEYRWPARWVETRSGNTQENAQFSSPLLRAAGIHTIILVTHYAHMGRAKRDFEAMGFEVIPAPVHVPPARYWSFTAAWFPSVGGLETSRIALYEMESLVGHWFGILH